MPKHLETDTFSAGYPRQSGGSDIDGRIDVAVVVCAAVGARPLPVAKAECVTGRTAGAAGPGGRVEAIDPDQLAPVPQGLVAQQANELCPPGVGDRAGMQPGAQHAFDRKRLDADRLVFTDQTGGEFVQEVLPGMAHGGMGAADLQPGLAPVLRSLLLARQPALFTGEPLLPS